MYRFSIKSALAASSIYWTHENKVWGSSADADRLYSKLAAVAAPSVATVRSQVPFDVPQLPTTGETCFLVKHYYNKGVKSTIHFIHRFPCYAGKWAKSAQDTINAAIAPPMPSK